MARLRVMQLVLSLTPGGTERLVIEICRRLSDDVESVVCCLDEAGLWADELAALGIPVIALGRSPGFHPSLAVRVARVIAERRIDVVHCHHYSPYVYGLLAKTMSPGTRLIFTEHGRLANHMPSRKRRLVNPWLARLPSRICAVSADLKQHMVDEGFPDPRIDVLYNGIDAGVPSQAGDRIRARVELGLPLGAFVVGTIARLDPVKNLALLLRSFASVLRSVPRARLAIVGDGTERAALEALAAELGISPAVHFIGYRSAAREDLAAFDLYVNTSIYEGVSLTILEAMAAGLPVIASRAGGNPEVVVDGQTGRLAAAGCDAMAAAMIDLAGDRDLRRAMGGAGRRRVEQVFSMTRMVSQYADAYRLAT